MEDKLKSLTETLYKDGLKKGQNEADELISKAKKQAEKIVEEATAKAKMIVTTAEKEASDKMKKVDSELALSSKQVITKIKNDVSNIISFNSVDEVTGKTFNNEDFMKELIMKIVESWDKDSTTTFDLKMALPKDMESALSDFIKGSCKKQLDSGLEVSFLEDGDKGVKVGPKDSSYQIEFTDESFTNFFNEYLKPLTREILFSQGTKEVGQA